jgi:hypothetical protein
VPFTEFYCNPSGSNLNAGSTTSTTAAYTCTNANWNGTSIFTPTDGTTPASTVSVGDFASVYNDGASVAVYVARVTAVAAGVNGAITLSTTVKSGTAPTSSATARTIKVGGAWKGPNGTEAFPFGFLTNALVNASGDMPYVNMLAGTNYAITAAMTHGNVGPIQFGGYTTTIRDGGKATIDGGTTGASYALLTVSNGSNTFNDLIFANNGATGSADLVAITLSAVSTRFNRSVFHDSRGNGLAGSATYYAIECEAYACNTSNTASKAGFTGGSAVSTFLTRCISHDNTGSNACGFAQFAGANTTNMFLQECIADSNGSHGIAFTPTTASFSSTSIRNCDLYNNGGSGLYLRNGSSGAVMGVVENCNIVKNQRFGIESIKGSGRCSTIINNCGYGTGTQYNVLGLSLLEDGTVETGAISYANDVTPWVDPANGDFRINLSSAKNAGDGTFTQTAASYAGTVGYPDIGSGQHLDSGGGGSSTVVISGNSSFSPIQGH